MEKKGNITAMIAIMFSFFVMGFVDIVNLSTSYIKQDFNLSDTLSNTLPMLVFVWFAVVSIPTGLIMSRIGRKNTVLLSALFTTIAMLLPTISYTLPFVLIAFTLLGIGNTILQVSLNPLLMSIVSKERVASSLTLGQFIKAICSFTGPIIISSAVLYFGDWKLVFPIYAFLTIISLVWLMLIKIETPTLENKEEISSIGEVFSLLKNKTIFIYFTVIILLVGYEVGLMTATPKYLLERWGTDLTTGGLGLSAYYIAKTAGAFLGAILLTKISSEKFFLYSMTLALLSYGVILVAPSHTVVFVGLFIVGLATSNIFAITYSKAMQYKPEKANEISSLMITGVAGGALIPPIMGLIADSTNQFCAILLPLACVLYMFFVALATKRGKL